MTRWARGVRQIAVVGLALAGLGCATPVGVYKMDARSVHEQLTRSVLSSNQASPYSDHVLRRAGLVEDFRQEPAQTLAYLHETIVWDLPDDQLFALAELSFLHASRGGGRAFYLASTAYAYAFLFREGADLDPFDPRLRIAADLYNRALALGLVDPTFGQPEMVEDPVELPFGSLRLRGNADQLLWGGYRLTDFESAAEIGVRGLKNRYRVPGIGAPMVASLDALDTQSEVEASLVPESIKVPVTVLVRFDDVAAGLRSGSLRGVVELYAADMKTHVEMGGSRVPLEYEASSALASTLADERIWQFELAGFFGGEGARLRPDDLPGRGLILLAPHHPGRVPVVFVHGTASSPGRWADLVNEMTNIPYLRDRVQPWLFMYETGQPIAYSAALLREALTRAVQTLDPTGADLALREMVVIGHSQGGLLTKLTVVSSGDRFWKQFIPVDADELDLDAEALEILHKSLYFEPLPFVRRAVFIATPHRGSFLAGGRLGNLVSRAVKAPGNLVDAVGQLIERNPQLAAMNTLSEVPSSIDNMTPGDPFLVTLVETPIASGVAVHSIIAVRGDGPVEQGDDGVVKYTSAHVEPVASEKVVRSGHSTQSHPQTMREVVRILVMHLRASAERLGARVTPVGQR